ncbi:flagellar hook-basal body protein [Bacillus sp. CGMCC 1.16607]|uniref:flagellar hook-basal body protein n=1 Tax=Bacillus sp. CGMCC 1.16607 TaxID=3351842 RepID=UPI00363249D9
MFRGFYTVASGMLSQQRRTEMLTNNMANANTPGFKADQSAMRAFPEMLLKQMGKTTIPTDKPLNLPYNQLVGPINTGVYMQETIPQFRQGDLQETGNKTDIALVNGNLPDNGSIFFAVQNSSGDIRYTRNGNFTVDGAGYLTTSSGQYILNEQGERIALTSDQFTISENGILTDANGQQTRLGVGFAENSLRMVKEGDGLFRTENGAVLPNAYTTVDGQFKLQQGFLERSNVDVSRAMTDMLSAYRAFEANQKVLQAYDRSMEKAANEIGKL